MNAGSRTGSGSEDEEAFAKDEKTHRSSRKSRTSVKPERVKKSSKRETINAWLDNSRAPVRVAKHMEETPTFHSDHPPPEKEISPPSALGSHDEVSR